MWCRTGRSITPCSLKNSRNAAGIPPGMSAAFFGSLSLIHQRKRLAPAVFADITVDHLAGFRAFEQRTIGTTVNTVGRILILRLLARHLVGRMGLGNPEQKPRGNSLYDPAHDLAPRLIHAFFSHEAPRRTISGLRILIKINADWRSLLQTTQIPAGRAPQGPIPARH